MWHNVSLNYHKYKIENVYSSQNTNSFGLIDFDVWKFITYKYTMSPLKWKHNSVPLYCITANNENKGKESEKKKEKRN